MNWIVMLSAMGLGTAALATAMLARRHAWRWGEVIDRRVEVGNGPFRTSVHETHRPRGIPGSVSLASVTSIVWGLLTGLVFAPAGLVLCAVADTSPIGVMGVLVVSVHGFVMAVRLCAVSGPLMQKEPDTAISVARASVVHHIGVIAAFAILSFTGRSLEPGLFLLAAIPCLLGLGLAALVFRAASSME
jgi:hypothetical protein